MTQSSTPQALRTQARLTALHEVLSAVSAAPLPVLLPLIANLTLLTCDAHGAWIMLSEDGRLATRAACGAAPLPGAGCRPGEGVVGRALLGRAPLLLPLETLSADPVLAPLVDAEGPVALVPIAADDEPLGLLGALLPPGAAADLAALTALAALAAAALAAPARPTGAARTQAVAQLRLQAQLLDAVEQAVIATDPEGTVVFWNRYAEQLYGWAASEAVGRNILDLTPAEPVQTEGEQIMQRLRAGESWSGEYLVRRRDGSVFPAMVTDSPIYGPDGAVIGVIGISTDISAQKAAEQALRQSEARFRHFAAAVSDVFWIADMRQRRLLYISPAYEQIWGRSAQPLYADFMGWIEAVHPQDRPRVEAAVSEYNAGGFDVEYRIIRPDGTLRWIRDRAFPMLDEHGANDSAARIAEDITAHKLAEHERDETLALLDALLTTAPTGIAFLDTTLRFQRINARMAEFNGAPVVAHLGRTVREVLPLLADTAEPVLRQVLATGEPVRDWELSGETAAQPGVQRHWLETIYPVRSCGGQILGLGVITTEITERKWAETRLARLYQVTAAFATALTPAQVGAVLVEQGLTAIGAQAGAVALLSADGGTFAIIAAHGYPPELIAQWGSFSTAHPSMLATAVRSGGPVWLPNRAAFSQYPAARVADDYSAACAAIPLMAGGLPIGVLGLSFALEREAFSPTDQEFILALAGQCAQALERARLYLDEQQARLTAQEATHARDVFLSIAAHELRSPLALLVGNAQLLERRVAKTGALPERDQRVIMSVIEQSRRLNRMIGALLDISRLELGQLTITREPCDLAALTRRVVDEVQLTLGPHTVSCQVAVAPLCIEGDTMRLEQVLHNLIQNAIKYSPDGGPVQVLLERRDGHAQIAVCDQGIGIPPAALPRLFQRFYRADNAAERGISGMGVGLYVVREIVALHRGDLLVESVEGRGSTFTIVLPLSP